MTTDLKPALGALVKPALAALCLALSLTGCAAEPSPASDAPAGIEKIQHIVVIYMENHSFDNLFGTFPGANGLANATAAPEQVDKAGAPYRALPQPINTNLKPPAADTRFAADLPNKPFDIAKYVPINQATGDLVHRYYQEQLQIDGGKMDKFAAWSDAAGLSMGYYDSSKTELWQYANRYVLADNFFHAALGGSFLNHFWVICACTPRFDNAPADLVAQIGANGELVKDGAVTPDGFAVNTLQPRYMPHAASIAPDHLLPPQDGVTIGDRLSAKGVTWAWYSGGWNDALAGHPDPLFQFHHQPFAYFKQFGDGTAAKKEHLQDETAMLAAIKSGTLPAVTFYKPVGAENQHPGYADVMTGDRKAVEVLRAIEQSPIWPNTVVVLTYDENGGYWDHVAPPKGDRWGPGIRVPTLVVSPFAKRGVVDHTPYDSTSILKLIEERYDLQALGARDAAANDLTNALNLQ
jgi:phospholipase C